VKIIIIRSVLDTNLIDRIWASQTARWENRELLRNNLYGRASVPARRWQNKNSLEDRRLLKQRGAGTEARPYTLALVIKAVGSQ